MLSVKRTYDCKKYYILVIFTLEVTQRKETAEKSRSEGFNFYRRDNGGGTRFCIYRGFVQSRSSRKGNGRADGA